jgi:hypothetical protein
MTNFQVMDHFPLQIIAYDDLMVMVDEVTDLFKEWTHRQAKEEWQQLAQWAKEALGEAFLQGHVSKDQWIPKVTKALDEIKENHPPEVSKEVQIAYLALLDCIYNAILRHVLRNLPTSLCCTEGTFALSQVKFWRYSRIRDTDKPALEQLMELLYQGGPRFEMEFKWHMMR